MKNKSYFFILFAAFFFVLNENVKASVLIDNLYYNLNSEKMTAILTGGKPEAIVAGILTIPHYVNYDKKNYEVVEIADHAFSNSAVSSLIEWINFPPSIETVGESAFAYCKNLWYYSWPGVATKRIGAGAFAYCEKLQAFTFPSLLEELGARALEGCTSLGVLTFGGLLKEVPFSVCRGCTSLRVVVVFPGSFANMKKIQDYAFKNCSKLSLVFLPSTLTYIGWAFEGCTSLTHVTSFMTTPPRISSETFPHPEKIRLEIPKGCGQIYMDTYCWNLFGEVEESDITEEEFVTGIKHPKIDNNESNEAYSITGTKVDKNHKGIKIIRDKNGKYIKVYK